MTHTHLYVRGIMREDGIDWPIIYCPECAMWWGAG